MPSSTSSRAPSASVSASSGRSGCSATASTPCGCSVSAADSKSDSETRTTSTRRVLMAARSSAPRGVRSSWSLTRKPRSRNGEASRASTVRSPSATNSPCRSLALRRFRSLARVNKPMRTLTALALVATLAGCAISTQQEVEMGAGYSAELNRQLPLVQDAELNRYMNVLGDSIARIADTRNLDWQFYIVDSPDVNAFAVPGGFIYMNRGLLERATNLAQVAGVLGHEIGHV